MALKREIPVHIHCATASEIVTCIRLADEFNLRLSLGHCYWAYLIVDELAKPQGRPLQRRAARCSSTTSKTRSTSGTTPAILAEAGLKVSLQTDALGGGQQNLRDLAALCVRYGMKEDDALKAITLREAEAVGPRRPDRQHRAGQGRRPGPPRRRALRVPDLGREGRHRRHASSTRSRGGRKARASPARPGRKAAWPSPGGSGPAARFAIKAGTILTMAGDPPQERRHPGQGREDRKDRDATSTIPAGLRRSSTPRISSSCRGLSRPAPTLGISSNWRKQSSIDETSKPVVPEMEVKHAVEPQAPLFTFARQLGITTALVTPGDRNVIGGQGAVVKTAGDVVDKMIIKDKAVMVFGFGASAKRTAQMPSTRMGIAALLRETLVKAQEYRDKADRYEKDKKGTEPPSDLSLEALLPVLRGEMPVLVHAEREDDILTALRIADEFKLKVILDGATDAWKVVDEIKKRDIPVILEDLFRGAGQDRGPRLQSADAGHPGQGGRPGRLPARRRAPGTRRRWARRAATCSRLAAFAVKERHARGSGAAGDDDRRRPDRGLDANARGRSSPGRTPTSSSCAAIRSRRMSVPEAVLVDGKAVYRAAGRGSISVSLPMIGGRTMRKFNK